MKKKSQIKTKISFLHNSLMRSQIILDKLLEFNYFEQKIKQGEDDENKLFLKEFKSFFFSKHFDNRYKKVLVFEYTTFCMRFVNMFDFTLTENTISDLWIILTIFINIMAIIMLTLTILTLKTLF